VPSKAEVEARLTRLGAFYVSDFDDLHEYWATSWGFTILIPIAGPHRTELDERDLTEIEEAILLSKP
jgi:hypothetical protein